MRRGRRSSARVRRLCAAAWAAVTAGLLAALLPVGTAVPADERELINEGR